MNFYLRSDLVRRIKWGRKQILAAAEDALLIRPLSITEFQAELSEGTKNDYFSTADYWWPNPATRDGLPYIRRDGMSNPNGFTEHRRILREMRTAVASLAASYRLFGDERFAEKAVFLLRHFFLDPDTRMNPSLVYAQAIPGICSGRGIGIIDTLHLIEVPVAIEVLRSSSHLSEELAAGLVQWFSDYLSWLTAHPYGIAEMNTENNHAVCWFLQAAVFARFTGNRELLAFCRDRFKSVLLPQQMSRDGSFPQELSRTKPYGYSIFVLDNLVSLCHVLSSPDYDLWQFQLPDGRGIVRGLEFLYPFLLDKSSWRWSEDVQAFDQWPVAMPSFLFAAVALNEQKYLSLWSSLEHYPKDDEVRRNMAIRQPLLWLRQASR